MEANVPLLFLLGLQAARAPFILESAGWSRKVMHVGNVAGQRNRRIASLDILKGLACLGVVFMHCGFPGLTGKVVSYVFKFNVPIFFMISGYFLYSAKMGVVQERLKKRIRNIAVLLLSAFLLYGIWSFVESCLIGQTAPLTWFQNSFSLGQLPHKLVFGTFFCGPMWYLYAAFWGYVLLYFLFPRVWLDKLLWTFVPLLGIHIALRTANKMLLPAAYDVTYYRSFLLYAIPFMLLGVVQAKYRESLVKRFSTRSLILLAVMGCCLQFVEYALTRQSLDFYFGSILYAVSLFMLSLKYPQMGNSTRAGNAFQFIGRNLSMQIYLVHMLCIEATGLVFAPVLPGDVFGWVHPLLSIAGSVLVSIAFYIVRSNLSSIGSETGRGTRYLGV